MITESTDELTEIFRYVHKKSLYFLCFVLGACLAVMLLYIELNIILAMDNFEEPTYILPQYHLELRGAKATLAHLVNFGLTMAAIIITAASYHHFRK